MMLVDCVPHYPELHHCAVQEINWRKFSPHKTFYVQGILFSHWKEVILCQLAHYNTSPALTVNTSLGSAVCHHYSWRYNAQICGFGGCSRVVRAPAV